MADAIDLKTATAAQLRAWKRSLDPEEMAANPHALAELDDLIIERAVEENVAKVEAKMETRNSAKTYDKVAYDRWPELKDKESDFYQEVNALLEDDNSADALLKASNEIGYKMFGRPGKTPRPDTVAPGNSDDAPVDKPINREFLERTAGIRDAFANEGMSFDEDRLNRIADRAEEDTDNG